MDPTSHISQVTLFYCLMHAIPLTDDERDHLKKCAYCQSVIDQWDTYNPDLTHAA